jgi:ribosomal protein S18 acetylase RimI-like enzyme
MPELMVRSFHPADRAAVLQIRTSNLAAVRFYESIGYRFDDVVSMGRRLVDDESG